jgi:hypothetical protein
MLTVQLFQGRHVPVILCHHCQQRIGTHEDAVVLYEEPGAPLMILHRQCVDKDAHQHLYSQPLDMALVDLVSGVGVDWDEVVRRRTKQSMLGE